MADKKKVAAGAGLGAVAGFAARPIGASAQASRVHHGYFGMSGMKSGAKQSASIGRAVGLGQLATKKGALRAAPFVAGGAAIGAAAGSRKKIKKNYASSAFGIEH